MTPFFVLLDIRFAGADPSQLSAATSIHLCMGFASLIEPSIQLLDRAWSRILPVSSVLPCRGIFNSRDADIILTTPTTAMSPILAVAVRIHNTLVLMRHKRRAR